MSSPPLPDNRTTSLPGSQGRRGVMGRPMGRINRMLRRLAGRAAPQPLLPMLVQVYAGFTKLDGVASEEEVESSLTFMRHDYPEELYSEMQARYREALSEPQDLESIADKLRSKLRHDEKIQLAAQLCVLITRSGKVAESMRAFESFAGRLGIGEAAKNIAGQLTEEGTGDSAATQVLESIEIGSGPPADLILEHAGGPHGLTVFRFQNLILVRNGGSGLVIARGRQLAPGECLRLYEGQRVVVGEHVLDYQDLVFYLNARKGVSSTQLYLGVGSNGAPFLEREKSRLSVLRIRFGLKVEIAALRSSGLMVGGLRLQQGQSCTATHGERVIFPDQTEITFAELRRRAREMGGRFDLSPSRSAYLVSNNTALLQDGDILLSASVSSEMLLRITCNYEANIGELEVIRAVRPVHVAGQPVREKEKTLLRDGAVIALGEGQYLRCRFSDGIIEEERNIIRELEVLDVGHRFGRGKPALENINLRMRRGEMICVMGPSGCGKSSLLRVLAGHLKPEKGRVLMNGKSLYRNLSGLCPFISFIPHEDAFDALLTVEENLHCAATMRSPHLHAPDIRRRVDSKLIELGLNERRHRAAGTPEQKILSSGERKRLNIGLDMVTGADVFLFDEPTSGLSSKDSEHILEIIRGLAHNKIVLVSIHQPSARLFNMFHKAILLDNGGKLVFAGPPQEMLGYFGEAWEEQIAAPAERNGAPPLPRPDFQQPEFIFDVLETPLRDPGGDVLYEEDSGGHMAPARRFPPDFWRDRYSAHSVLRDVSRTDLRRDETGAGASVASSGDTRRRSSLRERLIRLSVMMRRGFLSRLRNRGNMAATLLEAPILAALIAYVLRWSKDGDYNFASAFHIATWLFMSLVVAMFLGLTNSADEIIRDRVLLQRERNYNKNVPGYILSKVLSLGAVSLLQDMIYLAIGNYILEIHGMYFQHLLWMFLTSLTGLSIGLLISSLVRDARTALNIVPLILIPQIILGGALIKYQEMNENLDFAYTMRRWNGQAEENGFDKPSKLQVPLICEFMPLRWSYESMILTQANHNPYTAAQSELNDIIQDLAQPGPLSADTHAQLAATARELQRFASGIAPAAGFGPEHVQDLHDAISTSNQLVAATQAGVPLPQSSSTKLLRAFARVRQLLDEIVTGQLLPASVTSATALSTACLAAEEAIRKSGDLSPETLRRLDMAKVAMPRIFGLEERSPDALLRRMGRIVQEVRAGTYDEANHRVKETTYRAETVFDNQKVRDLVSKAEIERLDKRRTSSPNVFFGIKKNYTISFHLFGRQWKPLDLSTDTIAFNVVILIFWCLLPLVLLYFVLRHQLRRV